MAKRENRHENRICFYLWIPIFKFKYKHFYSLLVIVFKMLSDMKLFLNSFRSLSLHDCLLSCKRPVPTFGVGSITSVLGQRQISPISHHNLRSLNPHLDGLDGLSFISAVARMCIIHYIVERMSDGQAMLYNLVMFSHNQWQNILPLPPGTTFTSILCHLKLIENYHCWVFVVLEVTDKFVAGAQDFWGIY